MHMFTYSILQSRQVIYFCIISTITQVCRQVYENLLVSRQDPVKDVIVLRQRQTFDSELYTRKAVVYFLELCAILMVPSVAIASYPFGSHHGFGLFWILDRCCDDWIIAFANSTYLYVKKKALSLNYTVNSTVLVWKLQK